MRLPKGKRSERRERRGGGEEEGEGGLPVVDCALWFLASEETVGFPLMWLTQPSSGQPRLDEVD